MGLTLPSSPISCHQFHSDAFIAETLALFCSFPVFLTIRAVLIERSFVLGAFVICPKASTISI